MIMKDIHSNDYLVEIAVLYFGFGVFNANKSFIFNKSEDVWGYRSIGYLKPAEWAYALAFLLVLEKKKILYGLNI